MTHPHTQPGIEALEYVEMAQSRLRAAMMGDEPCKPCIDLAASYLTEVATLLALPAERPAVAQALTRQALEDINALISNGDRHTVNERNAFEHFTALNRLLLDIRGIARRALSSVSSTESK